MLIYFVNHPSIHDMNLNPRDGLKPQIFPRRLKLLSDVARPYFNGFHPPMKSHVLIL